MGSTVDQWLHFWDVPRRLFFDFSDSVGGVMMGYLLWETGNMCYNMLFHFINNALPVILLYAMQGVYSRMELYMEAQTLAQGTQDMLPAVGMYLMMASAAPGAIYIGNYLLHAKHRGIARNYSRQETGAGDRSDSWIFVFYLQRDCLFFSFQSRECYKSQIDRAKKKCL